MSVKTGGLRVECRLDPDDGGSPTWATRLLQKPLAKWIDFLYGPFFRVIGFFYRSYTANRARVAKLKSNEKVAAFLRITAILFLVGWILVWFFASDESRTRLVEEVRQSIGGFGTSSDQ